MRALLGRVTAVQPHPKNDELRTKCDIVSIAGRTNVSTRLEDGSPRYKVGDYAVVLVENLLLPEWVLRLCDLWNEDEGKGILAGKKGNRTKGRKIADVMSEVALCKVETWISTPDAIAGCEGYCRRHIRIWVSDEKFGTSMLFLQVLKGSELPSLEGIDFTTLFGIEPYENTNA